MSFEPADLLPAPSGTQFEVDTSREPVTRVAINTLTVGDDTVGMVVYARRRPNGEPYDLGVLSYCIADAARLGNGFTNIEGTAPVPADAVVLRGKARTT